MLLKMTAGMAGVDFALSPGDICEFEDAEAARLIEAGFAVAAEELTQAKRTKKGKADVVSTESDAGADDGAAGA